MKLWLGTISFFGIGVAIAIAVAQQLISGGSSMFTAIGFGAFFGAFGAWLAFYIGLKFVKFCFGARPSMTEASRRK